MAQKYESEYWSDRGQRRSDSICHRRIKARFLAKLEAHVEMTACKREGSGRRCAEVPHAQYDRINVEEV